MKVLKKGSSLRSAAFFFLYPRGMAVCADKAALCKLLGFMLSLSSWWQTGSFALRVTGSLQSIQDVGELLVHVCIKKKVSRCVKVRESGIA